MGLLTRASDTIYAFRFLRLLTTPWEKTGAYKAGLIDGNGRAIKKPETSDEKSVYNYFHRLVFNVKRLLNKVPFGKTTIASYLTALYLIKEHTAMSNRALTSVLTETFGDDIYVDTILESSWYQTENGMLRGGTYRLINSLPLPKTGEVLALRNTYVTVNEDVVPIGDIFGVPVYEAFHPKTNQTIYVTQSDLTQ
jgi:hypothetical protein